MDSVLIFDLARMVVVFAHLIACCIAIGLVLTSDWTMLRNLLGKEGAGRVDGEHLAVLQRTVTIALAALWLTGAAIVGMDVYAKGLVTLGNPKLQAKILVVGLLTINGVVLHARVLPLMRKAGALLSLPYGRGMLAIFCGAVSAVSWVYAAMLGVGRPLSWKFSLIELMAAYPVLIAGGCFMMMALVSWSWYRRSGPYEQYRPTLLARDT